MPHRVKIIIAGSVLFLACLLAGNAGAQHHIGIRGGYGGGTARFDPKRETRFLMGYPSFGISWKYYSAEPVVGGIQVDLQYIKTGYRELRNPVVSGEVETFNKEYQRTVELIQIPFFWQLHFYAFKRRLRVYLNLGVYASYMFSSEDYAGDYGSKPVWLDYEIKSIRDNPFGYGLAGGVGFSYLFNRFEAFVEGRYNFGFSDLLKTTAKYPGNVGENGRGLNRSPIDMINVSVGFYYRLGKGGILAPPPGTNRSKESWDSIPVGRNRAEPEAASNTPNNP